MLTEYLATGLIVVLLLLASVFFNSYIDQQPAPRKQMSGVTAWWVVIGNAYTGASIIILIGIWLGWMIALYCGLIAVGCFIVSGLPMIIGDYRRSERRKGNEIALEETKAVLGK